MPKAKTVRTHIDFDAPPTYIEWHVIDRATHRSIERVDEPDHALTHRAVAAGTAYVVEAAVHARVVSWRTVTEDTIADDDAPMRPVEEPTHHNTGEPTNQARAARVDAAITAYAERVYGNVADRADHATVTQDFLTDVCHWLHQHGLAPREIAERAINMAEDEVNDEERA